MAKEAKDAREELEQILRTQEAMELQRAEATEAAVQGARTDPEWWDQFVSYPDETMEEQDPQYWATKAVNLSTTDYLTYDRT